MKNDYIVIKGARENNLKNINLKIPRDKLIVFTGLSGSGKSSLAFETIYAEGQRRYMASLSSYARMFIGQMEKPDVDSIDGLSPSISIDQKTTSKNPRSTVGTVTEIYDHLRLLYARTGIPHCPKCGKEISAQTVDQMVDSILSIPSGTRINLLSPVVRGRKGEYSNLFTQLKKNGFSRVRVDGTVFSLDEDIQLEKYKIHNIEVVVDRLIIRDDIQRRLSDSLDTVLRLSSGLALVSILGENNTEENSILFSQNFACVDCGISLPEVSPKLFSFNSPQGACPCCSGLGKIAQFDANDLIGRISHRTISDVTMAMLLDNTVTEKLSIAENIGKIYKCDINIPIGLLDDEVKKVIVSGSGDKIVPFNNGYVEIKKPFEGILAVLQRHYEKKLNGSFEMYPVEYYMIDKLCPECKGERLSKEALSFTVGGLNISEFTKLSVKNAFSFLDSLSLTGEKEIISREILKEIKGRLRFLINVGLEYLTLSRSSGTLSGGESQRIRLATQIGAGLVGVLYILDEPSIGLHQRDNSRLLAALKNLRDMGNTLIVVEHDIDTMLEADYIVDIGPAAGVHGGELIAAGTPEEIMKCKNSLTGKYLSGELFIPVPSVRRKGNGNYLKLTGGNVNNLQNIDVEFPLGKFICVTGVSGSGKSSLINHILGEYFTGQRFPGDGFSGISGKEFIDKFISIDQSPIGRSPRSNPATYVGVFNLIRDQFAMTLESKARGYKSGRFSFNARGGRCEACNGDGIKKIEMNFLPDVYVPCEVCKGKRYNRETLEVKYKGKNIADVLDMTIEEAETFFEDIPNIKRKLSTLTEVGLGYMKVGQPSTTLSGGEAQRVKLAEELSKVGTGRTLYILDEPTTGLHSHDVRKLIEILNKLVDAGNTVIVIEHNLDVVKCADHIIDLGPEGGDNGGKIIATGTPEVVAEISESYTGQFLKSYLSR